jgi:hypothetical protein
MNKVVCCLFAFLLSSAAHAQTNPKVVFVGAGFTYNWQQTPQFTANRNWIGAGIPTPYSITDPGTTDVAANFQRDVVNQHPAFVHILTGGSDIGIIRDAVPQGVAWHMMANSVIAMVAMAQKANIKVILGNIPWDDGGLQANGDDPGNTQMFNAWISQYGATHNIPVVNYHDALCQCVGSTTPSDTFAPQFLPPNADQGITGPNDAGYALITQMAQIAIQTYGLKIKNGGLSNIETRYGTVGEAPPDPLPSSVNRVPEGTTIQFTPQAAWSDGVVRPILNQDFNGVKGTWISTNPAVMYINQQGQAFTYSAGTTSIWFISASGVYFSPWNMTVFEVYPEFDI